jgi:hypothetical protein
MHWCRTLSNENDRRVGIIPRLADWRIIGLGDMRFREISIYLADWKYDGVYDVKENRVHWLSDLKSIPTKYIGSAWRSSPNRISIRQPNPNFRNRDTVINLDTVPLRTNLNIKYNCPILVKSNVNNVLEYPVLEDFNFGSVLDPVSTYNEISNWISKQITLKESEQHGVITNKQKIETKGFDSKRSFRPKMK